METNDAQFANVSDFNNLKPDNFFYSVGENISKQPERVEMISKT